MVRVKQDNIVPKDDLVLSGGDALLVVADTEEGLSLAAAKLGKLEPGRLVQDRSSLDYIRVFVGKGGMVGVPLSQLALPIGTQSSSCSPLRCRYRAVSRSDAGVRRSCRRSGAARSQAGSSQHLWRQCEGDRGIQLRVARHRHGARHSARPDSHPDPRRRQGHARHRRRSADRGADSRQAASYRSAALDAAAASEYRAAQFWSVDLPRRCRHQCGPALRAHGGRIRASHCCSSALQCSSPPF